MANVVLFRIGFFREGSRGEYMKKIGLIYLIVLFITGLMVEGVQAGVHGYYGGSGHGFYGGRGHGYYGGWGAGIYLGVPLGLGWPGYPYGYYPYPAPPVVVQQAPVYVQPQQEEAYYWYYCQSPKGYYPYVNNCPAGWMKVVPNTIPQTTPPN
jgi:hypothetical protein